MHRRDFTRAAAASFGIAGALPRFSILRARSSSTPTSADLATGLIKLREVEEGCERASQSLTLAAELRHGVSIDRICKLERQLPPSHRSPAVRRLREQLAAVA